MSEFPYSRVFVSVYSNRMNHVMFNSLRHILRPIGGLHELTIPELLLQFQEVTTAAQVTKLANKVQDLITLLPPQEQAMERTLLASALTLLVQRASQVPVRLEAARWLRLLVQAAYISQPEKVFVTFVTAAVRASIESDRNDVEQRTYLKMILDCFWPFHYPYAAYNWELFPRNAVFYPLAPLLSKGNDAIQDVLLTIFAELPTLNDQELAEHVLPAALAWSNHANPERRQRITAILALMSNSRAQEALQRLQVDPNPLVSTSAKRAVEKG